ncbi:putative uncharacterized protein YGR160W [Cynara cardunculus var. scolymus]|uniref:putative uncharacterized protein YGR160W n=1 Tax=Cynara cardunculus var. scolymus TaxID=59895 RepID=UPI000D627375|nr:putative uncharacterized protein YGR160W [Cynara cardunculus var. scolymus]
MPLKDDVSSDLSTVKAEVKELLSAVQADILNLLQRPVPTPTPSYTAMDRLLLDQALEFGLLQARSLTMFEQRMDIIYLSLDNLFSCHVDDKKGEKDLADAVPTTPDDADVDAQRAEANEDEVVDDAVRADAQAHDEDLPITPAADVGDEEDDDDEDDDDSPSPSDARKDLDGDDDEDNDDDDFTI